MNRMQKYGIAAVIFALFVFTQTGFAGDTYKAKYAGEFLSTGAGARALALGGAFTAISHDVTSIYWNAAGLSQLNYPEATLMHAQRFSGIIKYNFAGFAMPFGTEASLGLGVIRLGIDDIIKTSLPRPDLRLGDIYDEDGRQFRNTPIADYTFSNAEYGIFLSYAKRSSAKLAWGASVKILQKGFDNTSAWGLGFDVGAQYQAHEHLILGANLQDASTTILAWDTGVKELIVPTLKLGAASPFRIGFLPGNFLPVFDMDIRFEGREFASQANLGTASFDFHSGLEYAFTEQLAARIGSDVGHFTAGAGIRFNKFIVDYAFMNHSELQETHRISILVPLTSPKYRRQ